MSKFTVRLTAFGLPDDMIREGVLPSIFVVKRKGEIWNARTGKSYDENIVSLEDETTYEKGYGQTFNRLFKMVNEDHLIRKYYELANYIELQVYLFIDTDTGIPSLHFEPEQIAFLNSLKAHVDIDIYNVTFQGNG